MRVVIRMGGSVVASPVDPRLMNRFAQVIERLRAQRHSIVVVVGGGELARQFITVARDMGLKEKVQDEIAISASRIYAQLFLKKIGDAGCRSVSTRIRDAMACVKRNKVAVMGGLKPGMTTDSVAALVAGAFRADLLIKATDQEGIFDKDPKRHRDARKLDRVRLDELSRVCIERKHRAGIHQIIDPEAIRILQRTRVKAVVVSGFDPENITRAVEGESVGTLVD
jgi:uridylate kinase